ncbi:DUF4082 domain-containing protein [Paenibacillus sp. PAMC21692]|uniref:DUF4082 domain-containing protein n=1 Tax=Paenibacillus sp. PAMC21692 TaxID=2762320 RepID=UPI00164D4BA2|nr:DUF4082 domain-containing protein [Paenibacillus sp. PAMC21692]QNK59195.1 DUF4082 domain-containing protein [Paenibacillus sp. PAMC21692]
MNRFSAALRICLAIVLGLTGTITITQGPSSKAHASGNWPVTATISNENGGPVFKINGTPVVPQFNYGSTMKIHPNYGPFLDTITMAESRDVHVTFWINVLDDMAWNEQVNEDVFQRDPNAYGIMRIGIADGQLFDLAEDQYAVTDRGLRSGWPSLASQDWRDQLDALVVDYIAWLKQQPYADRILGFQIMNMDSGEWYFDSNSEGRIGAGEDYSPPMVAAFRQWLTDKYETDAALQAGWNDPGVTLATAGVPTLEERDHSEENFFRSIATEGKAIDYQTFYSKKIVETINYAGGLFKRETDGQTLLGSMYGYHYVAAHYARPSNNGHYALGDLLASSTVDFISAPVKYGDRAMGINAGPMGSFDSLALHGKMFILENDTRTHLVDGLPFRDDIMFTPRTYSLDETLEALRRETGNQIVTGGGQYLMDINSKGWFKQEEIWDEYQKLLGVQASRYLQSADRQFKPDVAVIVDEDSVPYHTLNVNQITPTNNPYGPEYYQDFGFFHLFEQQQREMARSGVKFGYYVMSDLPNIPDSVKTFVFLNAYRATSDQRAEINDLKQDGNVLVFLRAPGYFDDSGSSAANISDLIGMTVAKSDYSSAATIISNFSDPATEGSGAMTIGGWRIGEDSGAVEPEYAYTPSFHVTDSAAVKLGYYDGETGKTAFARKDMGSWTSIFSGSGTLKAGLIRSIASNLGGAHVYSYDGKDNIRTDGKLLMIHSATGNAGIKSIALPKPSRVVDVVNRGTVGENVSSFRFDMEDEATSLFAVVPYDTADVEAESGSVVRTGAWNDEANPPYSGGTALSSNVPGSKLTFSFSGPYLSLIASAGPDGGRIDVEIDGVKYPYAELYAPRTEHAKEFVLALDLPAGTHSATLTVSADKHRLSTGTAAVADAFVTASAPTAVVPATDPETGRESILAGETPTGASNDARYELGTRFKTTVDGTITHVKLYAHANEGGQHVVSIWRVDDGVQVAGPFNWTFPAGNEGWKLFELPSPLAVKADTDYIVSVTNSAEDKFYVYTPQGFAEPIERGHLVAYSGSGVSTASIGTMPTYSFKGTNYFRDVVFEPNNGTSLQAGQTPERFDSDEVYELGTRFSANTNGYVTKARIYAHKNETGVHRVSLWNADDGTLLAGPYDWNVNAGTSGWKEFALPAPVRIKAGSDYIVSVTNSVSDKLYAVSGQGGPAVPTGSGRFVAYGEGVSTTSLGTMPTFAFNDANYFRDVVFMPDHEQTVLGAEVPLGFSNDARYELGTKFQTTADGRIVGVRLYAHPDEGGAHLVSLWRVSDGQRIAGPYTWDVSTRHPGWREFLLPEPVAISAGTDYIVSITNGPSDYFYAASPQGFAQPFVSGDLVTYEDSGVSTTVIGTMPIYTFNSTNYFRDVLFVPEVGNPEPDSYSIAVETEGHGTASANVASAGVNTIVELNATPEAGYIFKEWKVVSPEGLTIDGNTFTMPNEAVNVKAVFEEKPAANYALAVNGSYAAESGAGTYSEGEVITINAGSRSNYTFGGWSSSDGVTFTDSDNPVTTFTMPAKNVTVTAEWKSSGNNNGSTGNNGVSTPSTPAYNAVIKVIDASGNGAKDTTLPIKVDAKTRTAVLETASINNLLSNGGTSVITVPSITDVDIYTTGIPISYLSTTDRQGALRVNTDKGSVTVPSNMLTGVKGATGTKAEISIGVGNKSVLPEALKKAIGKRPLIKLSMSIDGKQLEWNNPNASVTVTIPYSPSAAELAHPEKIIIWFIDGSGKAIAVPNGHYDASAGTVTFTTTHFSDYAVGYNPVGFADVAANAWYNKAVGFIAARGITTGTGNGNYSPNARLTRGEFLVMLMRAYEIAPDENRSNNFADAGSKYYTGYLAAAKRLGIAEGIGSNRFAPNREITRQEMFALLYNALKAFDKQPQGNSGKTLSSFSDAGQIASWAKDAMTLLVETGTIGGSIGQLTPASTTTRVEMAQVLYNLLSK